MRPVGCALLATLVLPAVVRAQSPAARAAEFLYVWAGDADKKESDFLAVLDVRTGSPTYAQVLSTLPVSAVGTGPHHTEHQLEPARLLLANGFDAGRTFRFDLTDPPHPRLLGSFGALDGYSFPHSFVQLPGGTILSTFQGRGDGNVPPGGLVELDREGRLIRSASAREPGVDSVNLRPYSLAVLPAIDRVVSTSTSMTADHGAHLQVWRLSDLTLLKTIELPSTAAGDGHEHASAHSTDGDDHHLLPGEPRVLADGRTVLLATFTCGFYRVTGLAGAEPKVEFLRAFGGKWCAVPVLVGSTWVQTVPAERALVALEVAAAGPVREVGRVQFDSLFKPHWLAYDEGGKRLIVNDGRQRLMLVTLDPRTGRLTLDDAFRDPGAASPGVSFARDTWPHGATGGAAPHGSVFSRGD